MKKMLRLGLVPLTALTLAAVVNAPVVKAEETTDLNTGLFSNPQENQQQPKTITVDLVSKAEDGTVLETITRELHLTPEPGEFGWSYSYKDRANHIAGYRLSHYNRHEVTYDEVQNGDRIVLEAIFKPINPDQLDEDALTFSIAAIDTNLKPLPVEPKTVVIYPGEIFYPNVTNSPVYPGYVFEREGLVRYTTYDMVKAAIEEDGSFSFGAIYSPVEDPKVDDKTDDSVALDPHFANHPAERVSPDAYHALFDESNQEVARVKSSDLKAGEDVIDVLVAQAGWERHSEQGSGFSGKTMTYGDTDFVIGMHWRRSKGKVAYGRRYDYYALLDQSGKEVARISGDLKSSEDSRQLLLAKAGWPLNTVLSGGISAPIVKNGQDGWDWYPSEAESVPPLNKTFYVVLDEFGNELSRREQAELTSDSNFVIEILSKAGYPADVKTESSVTTRPNETGGTDTLQMWQVKDSGHQTLLDKGVSVELSLADQVATLSIEAHIEPTAVNPEPIARLAGLDFDLFDITLKDKDGKSVTQLTTKAVVRLPVDAGKMVESVIYLPLEGDAQVLPLLKQENGYVFFETEHFSHYGVIYKSHKTSTGTVVTTKGESVTAAPKPTPTPVSKDLSADRNKLLLSLDESKLTPEQKGKLAEKIAFAETEKELADLKAELVTLVKAAEKPADKPEKEAPKTESKAPVAVTKPAANTPAKSDKAALPKTGDMARYGLMASGVSLLLLGLGLAKVRKHD